MMPNVLRGERIGKTGRIRLACSVSLFDPNGEKILLTQRRDNGLWCLPGGAIEPGEMVAEAAVREMREETGLEVRIDGLIGVYSCPNRVIEYPDGSRWQIVGLNFAASLLQGTPCPSAEVSHWGFFSLEEIQSFSLMEHHWERITDAFAHNGQPFLR